MSKEAKEGRFEVAASVFRFIIVTKEETSQI